MIRKSPTRLKKIDERYMADITCRIDLKPFHVELDSIGTILEGCEHLREVQFTSDEYILNGIVWRKASAIFEC